MLKYTWNLAYMQPQNPVPLQKIQETLAAENIFIDYAIDNGNVSLTIFVPGETPQEDTSSLGGAPVSPEADRPPKPKRGRPVCIPQNDLTLERILNMRRLGVTADVIAAELGVSKRTYYRQLKKLEDGASRPYDTPFSEW